MCHTQASRELDVLEEAAAAHQRAISAEREARAQLYVHVRRQFNHGVPEVVIVRYTGLSRATVRRVIYGPPPVQSSHNEAHGFSVVTEVRDAVLDLVGHGLAQKEKAEHWSWEGSVRELYHLLSDVGPRSATWPKNTLQFGKRLALAADELERRGIKMESKRTAATRLIKIVVGTTP